MKAPFAVGQKVTVTSGGRLACRGELGGPPSTFVEDALATVGQSTRTATPKTSIGLPSGQSWAAAIGLLAACKVTATANEACCALAAPQPSRAAVAMNDLSNDAWVNFMKRIAIHWVNR
jgi:hypothetical protein